MSIDNDKARDEIFRRIRTAQNRSAPGAEDRAAAADYMARHPVGPQPPPYADARAQFVSMAERMSSTVESVGSVNDAPAEVAHRAECCSLARPARVAVVDELAECRVPAAAAR